MTLGVLTFVHWPPGQWLLETVGDVNEDEDAYISAAIITCWTYACNAATNGLSLSVFFWN